MIEKKRYYIARFKGAISLTFRADSKELAYDHARTCGRDAGYGDPLKVKFIGTVEPPQCGEWINTSQKVAE